MAGDPARQPERQERQERTVGPDPVGDRLGRDRRRQLGLGEDDAEGLPAPELDEDRLAGDEVCQGVRDEIGERPIAASAGRIDGHLDRAQPRRAIPALPVVATRRPIAGVVEPERRVELHRVAERQGDRE